MPLLNDFKYIKELIESSSDSDPDKSSSEDEEVIAKHVEIEASSSSDSSTYSFEHFVQPRRQETRCFNYIEETVRKYDDKQFKNNFRLERETCYHLIGVIEAANVLPVYAFGRKKITTEKAVLITIWYLSNTETFRQISDRFDVTKSSAYRIIRKIVRYLVLHSQEYIKWPTTERDKKKIADGFQSLRGIKNVLGAIDGSHINIRKPNSKHAYVYYNRKSEFSILLQGVCDHKKKFMDIFCGEPGSMHDARLLKRSSLYIKGLDGWFGNNFLLGDSAYPCLSWLVSPFKDNGHLTRNQKRFNYKHSSTRIVIENAFGLLKGRFRRLKFFDNLDLIFVVECVIASAVIHNICIGFDDEVDYMNDDVDEDHDEQFVRRVSGITNNASRRDEVFRQMFPRTCNSI